MSKNNSINNIKFILSLIIITAFIMIIVNADRFYKGSEPIFVASSFIQIGSEESNYIQIDSISIDEFGNERGILQYIVQPGDNLSKIAVMFGTTIFNIQKINNLKSGSTIKPGQKLIITDEEKGFLYTVANKTNIAIFAQKYNINLEELMTLNYIQDETEVLNSGQEIFINIDDEKAYTVGLKERPIITVVPKVTKTAYKPIINKPSNNTTTLNNRTTIRSTTNNNTQEGGSSGSSIIRKRTFKKNINNKFYAGHCTWYVATQVPEIFPYIDENNQDRPFGGNANLWYDNAKKAGFSVGQTPRVGSIIVYKEGRRRRTAGHVGIVIAYYPKEDKMIIRDMNRAGKFIVTERRESTTNGNIKGYIYRP